MFYKRKTISAIFLTCLIIVLLFSAVACQSVIPPLNDINIYGKFSVNFLDVGQGDCIFIRLPDQKNMLIDCGVNDYNNENINYINKYLNAYGVENIDYLILTHPDIDHVGNAVEIINNFTVKKAYIHFIHESLMENFPIFSSVVNLLDQKQIEYEISDIEKTIIGNGYFFAFLSPLQKFNSQSSYNTIAQSQVPSEKDINNLSPIIYFECFEKRFVFTGDAEREQELLVINNYKNDVYDYYHKNDSHKINLQNVDYLKVSHHGSRDASCKEFLSLLNPLNAIISVGNQNFFGHPSSEMLERLVEFCPNHNLFRTDVLGTISVYKKNDKISITSSKAK